MPIVGYLILGPSVTPSPDPLSQTVISLPLYLLYESSIFISAYVVRKKRKERRSCPQGGPTIGMIQKIAIGADHAGFEYKEHLKNWLQKNGFSG